MYNKILLAIDGSEHSKRATSETIKIATLSKCKVNIVFVASYEESKSSILHKGESDLANLNRLEKLAPFENEFKKNSINYEINILHGEAGPTIVEFANENNFDMLIVGSRGLNQFQEMVLGSVSHKVAKRANCPVLIVK